MKIHEFRHIKIAVGKKKTNKQWPRSHTFSASAYGLWVKLGFLRFIFCLRQEGGFQLWVKITILQ